MEQKWKNFSIYKKGLLLLLLAIIGYNVVVNMHVFTRVVREFFRIITPFVIGAAIAYLLSRPIVKLTIFYEKSNAQFVKKKAHILAVISIFLLLLLAVTVVIIYISPIITNNIRDLIGNLDIYYADAMTWVNSIEANHFLYSFLPDGDEITSTELLNAIPLGDGELDILGLITNSLLTVFTNVINVTTGIINFGMGLIIALYLSIYKISVLALVNRISLAILKPKAVDFIKKYIHKSNEVFYKFIAAQSLDAVILGTLATILLAILRVEYAVTFGILLGIFNMIPFFGSIIATLIVVAVTFFTGGAQQALITFGALLALQQLDAQFINPKITGDSLGMNPLVIVTAILIGGAYLGVLGMFISVPVAGILKIFLEDFLIYREQKLGTLAGSNERENE